MKSEDDCRSAEGRLDVPDSVKPCKNYCITENSVKIQVNGVTQKKYSSKDV